MLGPAEDAGLEEGAVDDQLTAAFEQVEQAHPALGPVELVGLLHRHPRHPSTLGGQRITRARQCFFLHQPLRPRGRPLLVRHDRRGVHSEMSLVVLFVCRLVPVHVALPLLFGPALPATPYLCDRILAVERRVPHHCSVNDRGTGFALPPAKQTCPRLSRPMRLVPPADHPRELMGGSRAAAARPYSAFTPANATTLAQVAVSAAMVRP